MKINVGSGGYTSKPGYINQDLRDVKGVHLVCDALDMDQHLKENSVDAFYSRHFFEHLTFAQGRRFAQIQYDLLKPGGELEMLMPCLEYHAQQILYPDTPAAPGFTLEEHCNASLYGWQRESDKSLWDVHKSGYTFATLSKLLENVGFTRIERVHEFEDWHLHVKAYKD